MYPSAPRLQYEAMQNQQGSERMLAISKQSPNGCSEAYYITCWSDGSKTDKSVLQWHTSLRETSNKQTNPHVAQRLVLRRKVRMIRELQWEMGLGKAWEQPQAHGNPQEEEAKSRGNKFKKVKFWWWRSWVTVPLISFYFCTYSKVIWFKNYN